MSFPEAFNPYGVGRICQTGIDVVPCGRHGLTRIDGCWHTVLAQSEGHSVYVASSEEARCPVRIEDKRPDGYRGMQDEGGRPPQATGRPGHLGRAVEYQARSVSKEAIRIDRIGVKLRAEGVRANGKGRIGPRGRTAVPPVVKRVAGRAFLSERRIVALGVLVPIGRRERAKGISPWRWRWYDVPSHSYSPRITGVHPGRVAGAAGIPHRSPGVIHRC